MLQVMPVSKPKFAVWKRKEAYWGLTVALWVSVLVALKVFDAMGWIEFGFLTHPVTFLSTGLAATVVLFPYLFRVSRSIWAFMFIRKKRIA